MNEREVRMIEREVYCDDGSIFLNKRPTWCAWLNTKRKLKKSTPLPSFSDSDDTLKAFSEYFTNKIITIANSFPPTSSAFAIDKTAYSEKLLRAFTPVTEQFVLEILQKTVSRSCDPLPTITNIINTPLVSGLVQPDFKTAIVKPLLKNPALTKLYWKKTTVQSKTYHLCVKPSKWSFYTHSLHTPCTPPRKQPLQSFPISQPHRTPRTDTALLRVVNDLLNAIDKDKFFVLLLLDLSAAFDTTDHQILLSRLETVFGIRSTTLQYLIAYLLNRNQCLMSTILLPLLRLWYLVFQGAQCWDLCCLVCTLLHFQSTISFLHTVPNFKGQLHQTTCKALHTTCNHVQMT